MSKKIGLWIETLKLHTGTKHISNCILSFHEYTYIISVTKIYIIPYLPILLNSEKNSVQVLLAFFFLKLNMLFMEFWIKIMFFFLNLKRMFCPKKFSN